MLNKLRFDQQVINCYIYVMIEINKMMVKGLNK